jgi:hypothetical protein
MKPTLNLLSKTKAELTAMARRKKIPVTSGMLKDDLIKAIKKGLRKIETQKKSKTAAVKTRKQTPASKTAKKSLKKKSSKPPKTKTAKQPKSPARTTTTPKRIKTSVKKTALKKSPVKGNAKKTSTKKSVSRKPKTVLPPKTIKRQTPPKSVGTPSDLPERYNDHRLVVLARDPNWAYAYWDLDAARVRDLLSKTSQSPDKARWVLRVFSAGLTPAEDKGLFFDINVDVKTGSYYLDLSRPGGRFIVEIGVIDSSGMFRTTAQSNPVILPIDHPSETIAPEGTAPSKAPTSPSGSGFSKPPSSRSQ